MMCKRPRGRQTIARDGTKRISVQVRLPPEVIEEFKRLGGGNLTAGIIQTHQQLQALQQWRTRHAGSKRA